MTDDIDINAEFSPAFEDIILPKRYKVYWGGRGSAKSWSIARALLIRGIQEKLLIVCAREFQNSIADSVHRLLKKQIELIGATPLYEVQKTTILGTNGTEFIFKGLREDKVVSIKSLEDADICWVEEAQAVSKVSWETLVPTIRKPGAEIWVSFNPDLEQDATYQRFVVNQPKNSIVRQVSWRDNPWFSEEMRDEMNELKAKDYDSYLHVWEGALRKLVEGAVYATELLLAQAESRITRVPHERTHAVHTFWDLGHADKTAIWFAQKVGFEYRLIDFYQNSQKPLSHYLEYLQAKKNYVYGLHWFPHDAKAKSLQTGQSIEQRAREVLGPRAVRVQPRLAIADGIDAAREIFPNTYIDTERCADGLQALRHYRFEVLQNDKGELSKSPVHDWSSHAADAFRGFALGIRNSKVGNIITETPRSPGELLHAKLKKGVWVPQVGQSQSWMR